MMMTKLIPAVYEHGSFRPAMPLRLPEHQKVLLAIAISEDEIPSIFISKLAEQSESFSFLNKPEEDIYSTSDGEAV